VDTADFWIVSGAISLEPYEQGDVEQAVHGKLGI
jgi:hypothetical protein